MHAQFVRSLQSALHQCREVRRVPSPQIPFFREWRENRLSETKVGGSGFGGPGATFLESAALLTDFIMLGRWLEALTRGLTSEAIRELMRLQPKRARVLRDGQELEIPAEEVLIGDVSCFVS